MKKYEEQVMNATVIANHAVQGKIYAIDLTDLDGHIYLVGQTDYEWLISTGKYNEVRYVAFSNVNLND